MRENCELCKNGKCRKFQKETDCTPTTISEFNKRLGVCDIDEVCENSSIYGNALFIVNDDDIEALKSGKVLFCIDEYGTFIAYEKGGANG